VIAGFLLVAELSLLLHRRPGRAAMGRTAPNDWRKFHNNCGKSASFRFMAMSIFFPIKLTQSLRPKK
jgi:hypothetical protein